MEIKQTESTNSKGRKEGKREEKERKWEERRKEKEWKRGESRVYARKRRLNGVDDPLIRFGRGDAPRPGDQGKSNHLK